MPVLARIYHIPPKEQARLILSEFRAIQADYRHLLEQQQGGE